MFHIELSSPAVTSDGADVGEELRACIGQATDSPMVMHRIGSNMDFDEIHGVEGGICFGVVGESRAQATHQALRSSDALRALLAAFPDAELNLTEPWLEWTCGIAIESLTFAKLHAGWLSVPDDGT